MRWWNADVRWRLLGLLVLGGTVAFPFAKQRLEERIGLAVQEALEDAGDGAYRFSHGAVRVDLFDRSVAFDELEVHVDTTRAYALYEQGKLPHRLAQFRMRRVEVRTRLWPLLVRNELQVRSLLLEEPDIVVHQFPGVDTEGRRDVGFRLGMLYELIAGRLAALGIAEFELLRGELRLEEITEKSTQVMRLHDVDLTIEELHIDSTLMDTTRKHIPVGDVRVRLGRQRILLGDSIHQLSFQELRFGFRGDSLTIDGFDLRPHVPDPMLLSVEERVVRAAVDRLRIQGLDLGEVYREGHLILADLQLHAPVVRMLEPHGQGRVAPQRADTGLVDLFGNVHVGRLSVHEGELELRTQRDAFVLLERIGLELHGIEVSPATGAVHALGPERGRLDVSRVIFGSISSGMQVFTGPLSWSHRKDRLIVLDIDADRIAAMASQGHLENGHLDTLLVEGFDVERLLREGTVHAHRAELRGFDLHLPAIRSGQGGGGVEKPASIPLEGSHFDELALIGRVTGIGEPGGSEVAGTVERFELLLQGLDLDSAVIASRPLVAEHAHLVLSGVDLRLPRSASTLALRRVVADSRSGDMEFAGGAYIRNTDGRLKVDWDRVAVGGLDVPAALKDRALRMRSLVVQGPVLQVQGEAGGTKQNKPKQAAGEAPITALRVGTLKLEQGRATVMRDGKVFFDLDRADLAGTGVGLDEAALAAGNYEVVSDALEYTLKDITASLAEGTHQLHTRQVEVDVADSLMVLRDVHVVPRDGLPKNKDRVEVSIPEVIARGYDPFLGQRTGVLDLGRVLVHAPRIRTVLHTRKKDDQPSDRLPVGLSLGALPADLWAGRIKAVVAERYDLQGGSWDLTLEGPDSRLDLQFPDVELGLEALAFRVGARATRERPLPARRVTAQFLGSQWKLDGDRLPVKVDRISLDLPDKGLQLKGIALDLDTKRGGKVRGTLDEADLEGVALYDLLREERVHAERFVARGGDLTVVKAPEARAKTRTANVPLLTRLREAMGQGLDEDAGLDALELDQVRFRLEDPGRPGEAELAIDDLGITVHGLRAHPHEVFHHTGLDVDLHGMRWRMDEDQVDASIGRLRVEHIKGGVELDDLHIAPHGDRGAYARSKGHRFDALDITLPQLRASGFNVKRYLEEDAIEVRRVELAGLVFDDLRDHRLPQPEGVRDLPAKALHGLKRSLQVDSLVLRNGTIRYAEVHPNASKPGRIALTDVGLRAANITNARSAGDLTAVFTGLVQRHAPLRAEVRVPLNGDRGDFDYRLQVGDLDMTTLAEFIEPVLFLRVREGRLDTLRLVGAGNDDVALGQLYMYYEDLQVALLNKRTEDYTGFGSHVASLAANALVRKNKPNKGWSDPTPLYFERLKDRGFVNYLIKLYLSGVPGAIGLGEGKERREVKRTDEEYLKRRVEQLGL